MLFCNVCTSTHLQFRKNTRAGQVFWSKVMQVVASDISDTQHSCFGFILEQWGKIFCLRPFSCLFRVSVDSCCWSAETADPVRRRRSRAMPRSLTLWLQNVVPAWTYIRHERVPHIVPCTWMKHKLKCHCFAEAELYKLIDWLIDIVFNCWLMDVCRQNPLILIWAFEINFRIRDWLYDWILLQKSCRGQDAFRQGRQEQGLLQAVPGSAHVLHDMNLINHSCRSSSGGGERARPTTSPARGSSSRTRTSIIHRSTGEGFHEDFVEISSRDDFI